MSETCVEVIVSTPLPQPGTLSFRCNICSGMCTVQLDSLAREVKSCPHCSSSPRTRAVIRALSTGLFQQNLIISDFPDRKDLKGLGFTDAEAYARPLAQKFDYVNTFLHKEPRLDIASDKTARERRETYDFILCSEVFEHVVPPVEAAFQHVHEMLKPGGLFVLSVPYGHQPDIIEHFPELHEFVVAQRDGLFELRNVTRSGVSQVFRDLVFHGGPGSTLEMRVFSYSALLRLLRATGFDDITIHDTADFQHGIWWPQPWSLPFTARKPRPPQAS
jgi:SAM-dependent methyltransferase